MASQDCKVQPAQRVRMARRDFQVQRAKMASRDCQVQQVRQARTASQDCKVQPAQRVRMARRGQRVQLVLWDLQAQRAGRLAAELAKLSRA